ncbi:MAG: glucose-6-phosphate dehydrogenase [Candidatus Brocadiaceae bacterium]|nr:glucose-6-phosphate dehydrogenase [Candidatus Brocadiaceae bacterium]
MFETSPAKPEPGVFVILGGSGDLTRRKLVPALYNLAREGLLPERSAVVGYGRSAMTDQQFRSRLREGVERFSRTRPVDAGVWEALGARTFYVQGDYGDAADHARLRATLAGVDERCGTRGNRIFYLSVPPHVVVPALEALSASGNLERRRPCEQDDACYLRVVFEKPFGRDLESARALNAHIDRLLDESQTFRMDHYLGKETVQSISVLRFANSVFEHVWNAQTVRAIRVTVAEALGMEGRGGSFDSVGLLRDILQNHVLQLLTLVTMEPPAALTAEAVRDEKAKVLRCLRRLEGPEVRRSAVRGQYGGGTVDGRPVPAYREEEGVAEDSTTETFVGIRTHVDNWRWAGVPIYLCAGKRLAESLAEVAVEFKEVPPILFRAVEGVELQPNRLTLRVQPDEGVSLRFATKVPGLTPALRNVKMDFPYGSASPAGSPEAYERLLLDVMAGNSALFARRDEVELAWQFAGGILDAWEAEAPAFPNYAPGTWGPVTPGVFFREDTDYSRAPGARGV